MDFYLFEKNQLDHIYFFKISLNCLTEFYSSLLDFFKTAILNSLSARSCYSTLLSSVVELLISFKDDICPWFSQMERSLGDSIPRSLWSHFLLKSWSSQQDLCLFDVFTYFLIFVLLPFSHGGLTSKVWMQLEINGFLQQWPAQLR